MSIYLHHTTILPGELAVHLNTAGQQPFASVGLGDASLSIHTPAEADSLIKAACEAKRLLEEAAGPSPVKAADDMFETAFGRRPGGTP